MITKDYILEKHPDCNYFITEASKHPVLRSIYDNLIDVLKRDKIRVFENDVFKIAIYTSKAYKTLTFEFFYKQTDFKLFWVAKPQNVMYLNRSGISSVEVEKMLKEVLKSINETIIIN